MLLREHLLAGRLTLDEFSERVEAVLQARVGGNRRVSRKTCPTSPPRQQPPPPRRPARFTAAIFGHVACRGGLTVFGGPPVR
ncbi:MAG TPA: hypothetical protein DHU96_35310 [Actinobacteria bacterium]|nr:hypothetical protein [Actinomycetota bacterium]